MADPPRLFATVIVPTFDRKGPVERCLRGLLAQDLSPEKFEVILVDDGSTDGSGEHLSGLAEESGRPVRVIRRRRGGPAAARNAGAEEARGEVLAFTDSDAVPDPSWLRSGLAALEDASVAGVEGKTICPRGDRGGPFARRTENTSGGRYLGCNLFIRRDVFRSAGGFDERFGLIPFREDTDLAHRIMRKGGRISFAPDSIVSHPVERGNWRAPLLTAWRYRNDPLLLRNDWWWYLSRVDNHRLGSIVLPKPRLLIYSVFLLSIPALVLAGPLTGGIVGILSLAAIVALHLRRGGLEEAQPSELLLLPFVCSLVPVVLLAAILTGAGYVVTRGSRR